MKWIGTSWKMNKTLAQSIDYAKAMRSVEGFANIQRFLIPPFTSVREVRHELVNTDVLVGAQNMHWESEGAWTGEISPPMLVDCQLDMVELGHSERRIHFGETDQTIALKVAAALDHRLIPLICVGETREQRDSGLATQVLTDQVGKALSGVLEHKDRERILFAYEPVWAIGKHGEAATAEYANLQQSQIAKASCRLLGVNIPCLYGGSVNQENCQELIACEHIDGLFIGRAALDPQGYLDILKRCERVCSE